MKVLQIITTLAHGGAQATVLASCENLPSDVEVVVAAGMDDTGEGSLRTAFADTAGRLVPVEHLRRWIAPASEARAMAELVALIHRECPDVIHTHSSKAGALGRLAAAVTGIPLVHTVHGWSFNGRDRLAVAGIVRLERRLAAFTDAFVVVAEADAERGIGLGIGQPERYRLIRAGVELSVPREARVDRVAIRRELGLGDDTFAIGTVARLDPAKDVPGLVEAFAGSGLAERGARLIIVGDGAQRALVESAVARRGLSRSVDLLGHRRDGARLVAAFDCFALSSRWEGMPRALVEAVAARVPVVATRVGGVAELVGGGAGLLEAPGDPAALARALRQVADRPSEAADRAGLAESRVEQFGVTAMRRELLALWREVAAGHRRGLPGSRVMVREGAALGSRPRTSV